MATESVTARTKPELDVNAAHECITKARGIVEMIGAYAIATFGYDTAQPLCGSAWAICDQLDQLAVITGLDPQTLPEEG